MRDGIDLRAAVTSDAPIVAALFEQIVAGSEDRFFHPHPFTTEAASRLCGQPGKDLYFVAMDGAACVAWGMLRGWNEGYEVPSLGLYVAPSHRGRGLGRAMMEQMRAAAVARGAPAIRLKAHPENARALDLYHRQGYRFGDTLEHGQRVGRLELGGRTPEA